MKPPPGLENALRDRNGRRNRDEILFQCPHPENHENGDAHPSARYHLGKAVWYCDVCGRGSGWKKLCELLGVQLKKAEVVASYVYRDEAGTELRHKQRWEPGFRGEKKSFTWQKPDGHGGWVKSQGDGNPKSLYRSEKLPAVREQSETAFVVEGEKDADAGDRLGLPAFCNPEGAAGESQRPKWVKRYSRQLKGLPVVIIADKDKPGRAHAQAVAKSLSGLASSVRLLELPGDRVKDLSDWISQQSGRSSEKIRSDLERLVAEGATAPANEEKKQEQTTQAQILIELAEDAHLFHDPDHTPYAIISVNDHSETWTIRSKSLRRWLVRRFYSKTAKPPSTQAINDTLGLMEARAQFDGESAPVFTRLAEVNEKVYLDLGTERWDCVEIAASGWRVLKQSPSSFRRTKGMAPICRPLAGGSLVDLREFLNLPDDTALMLVVAWLVAACRPTGPYPILILQGEQGSAKSTTARVLRSLLDPSTSPVRTMPREERDLMIAAQNAWVLAFDNLSGIPNWLSDAFCRLATGGGFSTRQLYSDDEEKIFEAQRPLVLNGISELTTRQDLLDRALIVTLPPIPETNRRTERDFWSEFEAAKPKLLGALLTAVSTGLRRLSEVQLNAAPRMADFALWVTAAEPALPWPEGAFLRAYEGNRAEAVELALESDLVATAVRDLMADRSDWTGTATQLLTELERHVPNRAQNSRAWPKSARALSGRLRRIATFLRSAGVDVDHYQESGARSRRMIAIRKPANSCDATDATDAGVPEVPLNQSLTHASQDATLDASATQSASQDVVQEALKDGPCVASVARIPAFSTAVQETADGPSDRTAAEPRRVQAVAAAGSPAVYREAQDQREELDL